LGPEPGSARAQREREAEEEQERRRQAEDAQRVAELQALKAELATPGELAGAQPRGEAQARGETVRAAAPGAQPRIAPMPASTEMAISAAVLTVCV